MYKRRFILLFCLSFLSFCGVKVSGSDSSFEYPFKTLADAFHELGFDPSKKDNSFFVITADVHYGGQGEGMLSTVNEVNKMYPYPEFFCVNGDMIVNGSLSFGSVPTVDQKQIAINEYKAFKKDAELLNQKIRLILALGNHDTHPMEVDPEIFWEVFPGYPPYQSFNSSGVHIVVLNGHSTGYIDTKQMEWLTNDVNEISIDQPVIIIIHQPSMSHRTRERGIPEAISNVFADHQGIVWLIGGHEHSNSEKIFQLGKTKLVQHGITCGAANIWGGPESPGYWIYCLRNGKVLGRIFRKLETGYRIQSKPDLNKAEKVPMPFDHLENIAWKVFAGSKDFQKSLIHTNGRDCNNWWSYVSELNYRIPLKEADNNCIKVAMLCDYGGLKDYQVGQYFMSLNQKNWEKIKLEKAEYETMTFIIPINFRKAENLYFKFIAPESTYIHIGGFALMR